MEKKQVQHIIKGMNRDLSDSKVSADYAYENMNIRITARENGTLLSITNEKGNKEIPLKDSLGTSVSLSGDYIGSTVLNSFVVLFLKGDKDRIYRLEDKGEYFESILLYEGSLDFNVEYPVECLNIFENEAIQKVYWIDGLNQSRFINIAASDDIRGRWNDNSFNFVQTLQLKEEISVTRNEVTNGAFTPGTIQYAFTYYNRYGQESNIFYTTPLQYISFSTRGASPEDKVGNSFTLDVKNIDANFDCMRIYAIHRTSVDATPSVRRITDITILDKLTLTLNNPVVNSTYTVETSGDLSLYIDSDKKDISMFMPVKTETVNERIKNTYEIDVNSLSFMLLAGMHLGIKFNTDVLYMSISTSSSGTKTIQINSSCSVSQDYTLDNTGVVSYIDTGLNGDSIDPTELLYVGGEEMVFQTMAQKDNTLFLGNAEIKRKEIPDSIIRELKGGTIIYEQKQIGKLTSPSGFYPYNNTLKYGSNIKTFKSLEWYRFGVQFQHKSGKWSEPVWINDAYNDKKPSYDGHTILVQASGVLGENVINAALNNGFIKARGVVVYPSINNREVIAQGMLCPTVYNVGDRFSNSPFAQASWFSRPFAPFDLKTEVISGLSDTWMDYSDSTKRSIDSLSGTIRDRTSGYANENNYVGAPTTQFDLVNKGSIAEFRHDHPIPNNYERNAEIQCIADTWKTPLVGVIRRALFKTIADGSEYFFVDQSIVTMHSPDIEFDDSLQNFDISDLKMRIVGLIPVTGNSSDIDIQTSTPANDTEKMGFYKEFVGSENNSLHGYKSLMAGAFWFDKLTNLDNLNDDGDDVESYMVYPWHRNGSLNNQSSVTDGTRTAMLSKKKLSNLKFSSYTKYFDTPWNAYQGDSNHTGISGVSIFNSNEMTLMRLPAPLNSDLSEINYYGNIDKVLTPSRNNKEYTFKYMNGLTVCTETLNKEKGYPIVVTGMDDTENNSHELFTGDPKPLQCAKLNGASNLSDSNYGTDPVSIKYKSTPHAVFSMNYTKSKQQVILPTIYNIDSKDRWRINDCQRDKSIRSYPFWNNEAKTKDVDVTALDTGVYQDVINYNTYYNDTTNGDHCHGYYFLAELYNDNIQNRFGGQTEEAFENNQWLPCGEPVALKKGDSSVIVKYTEGDTFFQRYDCMKTYPYTLEDQNSITEIVSFMVETKINLDGRYDRNRGQTNNLSLTPSNFNLFNKIYNQKDNFFSYRGLNHNNISLDYFPNTLTWTKEKQLGSLVDTWTNITFASTLDLDGDKGEIVSLNNFSNEIFCFQKNGFSNILFNSRVQIPTSDDTPIEISNGQKVSGKKYINNTTGCNNKWSIAESPLGIYFIDNETNSIYLYNGQLSSISDKAGFRSWLGNYNSHLKWNASSYNNFRTFYDRNNNDVYFTNKDICLCYSELLQQFTSFMSYNMVPSMFNISSELYAFKNNKIWKQFEGDYNMFFNEFKPYSIEVVSNQNSQIDKIFTNIDLRSYSYDSNEDYKPEEAFDSLDVHNNYQYGNTSLIDIKGKPSSLKKKFSIWRLNIPRNNIGMNNIKANKLDRIRSPWVHIKLSKTIENTYRTEFHDMIVNYFI